MRKAADRVESTPRRVGVFGGTFDPPHLGHASVARDVADALSLDTVLWIPARIPPHKSRRGISPPEVRLEMVQAASQSDARFAVSEIELERPGPSYTVDTLRALAGPDLYLIIGYDQYLELDTWHEPAEILSHAHLAVMDRRGAGVPEDLSDDPSAPRAVRALAARHTEPRAAMAERVIRVPVGRVDVSSTLVRERVRRGRDVSNLVSPSVLDIIRREGLYR